MSGTTTARIPGVATGVALLVPISLSVMAIVLLAPVLPQLLAEFANVPGASYLAPMVLTIPALCVALLSPVAGIVGDYFGRRRLLILSLLIYGVVGTAPIFLTNLYALLASRIAVGIAEALIMVLTTTLIGDFFTGAVRDRWLAGQTALASTSALLFFNLGGYLGRFGWRTPFWVYAGAVVMLAGVLRYTWEPVTTTKGERNSLSWRGFPVGRFAGILVVTVFASVMFYTVQIHASLGLNQLGLKDPARIGTLTSIASLGVPLGTFIYARLAGTPVRRLVVAEFALMGIGFLLMSHASGIAEFLLGCGINQLGAGMTLPTMLVWAMSQLHFEIRGRGAGLWTGSFSLGQWLSPIVITFFSLRMGGLLPALSVIAYAAFAAAAVAVVTGLLRARPGAAVGRN